MDSNQTSFLIDLLQHNIQGIIFDCDGTLVDTMPAHNLAWEMMFKKYNVDLPLSCLDKYASCPSWMLVQDLMKDNYFKGHDYHLIGQEKEDWYFENLDGAKLYENVFEYVKFYFEKMPMIVLSGGGRKGVIKSLEFHDLSRYFNKIIAADDGYSPKSEAQVFLDIANEFAIDPESWVVFEDGDVGIRSGRAAGMKIIDVREQSFKIS